MYQTQDSLCVCVLEQHRGFSEGILIEGSLNCLRNIQPFESSYLLYCEVDFCPAEICFDWCRVIMAFFFMMYQLIKRCMLQFQPVLFQRLFAVFVDQNKLIYILQLKNSTKGKKKWWYICWQYIPVLNALRTQYFAVIS